MRILITRPLEESVRLASKLGQKKIRSLINPLLEIIPQENFLSLEAPLQSIVLTSKHAAPSLKQLSADMSTPIYTVGDETRNEVLKQGYTKVISVGKDVNALKERLLQELSPEKGIIIHAASNIVHFDLENFLKSQNFQAEKIVTYISNPVPNFSEEVENALKKGEISHVLFFSPRTAKLFIKCFESSKLSIDCLKNIVAVCISKNVADIFNKQLWKEVLFAPIPTEDAVIDLIVE